jgi:hypothetical protein
MCEECGAACQEGALNTVVDGNVNHFSTVEGGLGCIEGWTSTSPTPPPKTEPGSTHDCVRIWENVTEEEGRATHSTGEEEEGSNVLPGGRMDRQTGSVKNMISMFDSMDECT